MDWLVNLAILFVVGYFILGLTRERKNNQSGDVLPRCITRLSKAEIEKESKEIKRKFDLNQSKKENVIKQFAQLEKVQNSAMTKFEQMQQQKCSVEQRSEQFQSQSENFQSSFQQLTQERQKMEMMEVEVEKR